MLTVSGLKKRFGPITAVRDISFDLKRGDVLGFLGPNGAGKSTTMRMITGFLPPSGGTAVIDGFDIREQSLAARRRIGYLPENAPVYEDTTVHHFLNFIAEIRGYRGRERRQRVDHIMALCKLAPVRQQSVDTLSKGYRQRVCLAQAILHDPPLLIMDEPTDGLDPNQKALVRQMILEMASAKAVIISTHILEEVEAVCNRTIIINDGAIVAEGAPDELKKRSASFGAVTLQLATMPANLSAELEAMPSAKQVVLTGANRITVYPRKAETLLTDVMETIRRHGWKVTSMSVSEGRLDDTFRDLTQAREEPS